jgi:hypothetical protein
VQGSIKGWRQQTRRAGVAGLTLALAGGVLAATMTGSIAGAAQTATESPAATPGIGACRTSLPGDQTSLTLFDLSQFVPVSELAGASAAPAADDEAPAIATPLPATTTMAPAATPDAAPAASPIASPQASPVAETAGAPAEMDALRSLVFGVLNCTSQGDFTTLGGLVSDTYLSLTFAGGADLSREDLLALAAVTVIPQQELIAFDNVDVSGDRATAEVISSLGNQLRHEQWSFVRDDSGADWIVDRVTALMPLAIAGSVTTNVEIDENGLGTDPREVESGNVVLLGSNSDSVDHEMLVLRLPQGTTTEILLQTSGPELPEGVVFIGQMTVPAVGEAVLPLMNLPAGNYVVVDMLLDDTGTPNLAQGYRARLIVQ